MGNSESSSSSPSYGSSSDYDQSKKKDNEEETSAADETIKVGTSVAGTALLALGAWTLSSSSVAGTALLALGAWTLVRSRFGGSSASLQTEGLTGDAFDEPPSKLIKIMNYNVWSREDLEVSKRMSAIGRIIQRHSPDVIFFQEVTPLIYSLFESSQWWKLYECSVPPERAGERRYFCMLMSKLPVKRFINKGFKNTKGKEICVAELDVGSNKRFFVANSHLKSPNPPKMNSSKRVAQAEEALRYLGNLRNVVFGGDMNWDEITDGPFPLHRNWIDAWTECRPEEDGWTYDTKANQMLQGKWPLQKRLDRLICKLRDFEIIGIKMIGMEAIPWLSYFHKNQLNPVYPSDHFGLLLTLSTI